MIIVDILSHSDSLKQANLENLGPNHFVFVFEYMSYHELT